MFEVRVFHVLEMDGRSGFDRWPEHHCDGCYDQLSAATDAARVALEDEDVCHVEIAKQSAAAQ